MRLRFLCSLLFLIFLARFSELYDYSLSYYALLNKALLSRSVPLELATDVKGERLGHLEIIFILLLILEETLSLGALASHIWVLVLMVLGVQTEVGSLVTLNLVNKLHVVGALSRLVGVTILSEGFWLHESFVAFSE